MPLLRKPTTEELEDHLFGSGAFSYGWFNYEPFGLLQGQEYGTFPIALIEWDEEHTFVQNKFVDEQVFIDGIKKYAETLEDRTFDDLIEDMDSHDVDNVLQLIMFGDIEFS